VDGGPGHASLADLGAVGETELDVETVIGTAPSANIVVYQGPDLNATFTSYLDLYNRIVSDDTAQVLSSSYYGCEFYQASYPSFLAGENTLFEEAAAQGQSNLAIAGDTGSEGCLRQNNKEYVTSLYVADPASSPWVTGVGGTANTAFESAYDASIQKQFPAEEGVWNIGCDFNEINGDCSAGGGGESVLYPRPKWQTGPGVVNPKYPNKAREVPDVSASADYSKYPYIIYSKVGIPVPWSLSGGTSAAAPLWAGVLALTDAECRATGVPPVGFANPALYVDAVNHPKDFYDVTATSGAGTGEPANNDVTGKYGGAYPATVGYDMATGLGTPHAATLAANLCATQPRR
jgi:subtilase family serine protease